MKRPAPKTSKKRYPCHEIPSCAPLSHRRNTTSRAPLILKALLPLIVLITAALLSPAKTHAALNTDYVELEVTYTKANGETCSEDSDCTSGNCTDGYCCDTACDSTCEACDVSGSEGTCSYISDGTDPDGDCSDYTCTNYVYGWDGADCNAYSGASVNNGMCDGSGSCYGVTDSCTGSGSTLASCGSDACKNACTTGELATGFDEISEICYVSAQGSCGTCQECDATATCANVAVDTDPYDDCAVGEWVCLTGCSRQRNSGDCDGSGACASDDETGYCSEGTACSGGTCDAGYYCNNGAFTYCSCIGADCYNDGGTAYACQGQCGGRADVCSYSTNCTDSSAIMNNWGVGFQ